MSSVFWRKAEQPIRIAVFVSANALAQIVGALLLYGCGSIKGAALEGWRVSFLVAAGLTVIGGIFFFVFVPVSPMTAWYLTPEERQVAVQRVAQERAVSQLVSLFFASFLRLRRCFHTIARVIVRRARKAGRRLLPSGLTIFPCTVRRALQL